METTTTIVNSGTEQKRVNPVAILVLKAALAIVLLLLLFRFVSLSDVAAAMLSARLEYLAMSVFLLAANLGLQFLKWRYFVRLINPSISNFENAASLLLGITLGTLTPGQVGEFGGRVLRMNSLSAGSVVGLTLVDRLQMLCVMGSAGTISLVFLYFPVGIALTTVAAIISILFLIIFFNPQLVQLFFSRVPLKILRRPWVNDLLSVMSVFTRRNLLTAFCYSSLFYLVVAIQMALLLNAFGVVQWSDAFLGFAAMMFFKALVPISIGDLGTREASSVYFYSLRGISAAAALNASLLLFVINILIPSILGLAFTPQRWLKK